VVGDRGGSYGLLGAAAGCAIGHHEARKNEKATQTQHQRGCEVSVSLVQWKLERPYLALPCTVQNVAGASLGTLGG
jgi:hypothetical protein